MSDPTITEKEGVVLALLIARGELYGLQLVDASDGAIKTGTVYTTLARMLRKGLISDRLSQSKEGEPLRVYRATGLGERAFHAWRRRLLDVLGEVAWES